jgi:hypothetical protein
LIEFLSSISFKEVITWFSVFLVLLTICAVAFAAFSHRLGRLYLLHFHDERQERLFLSSVAFFITFIIIRGITHAIRAGVGPFHNVSVGTMHIHHLVWGILILLIIGYLWLMQIGTGVGSSSGCVSGLTAIFYGIGSALTLDEFALWLNLKDVYWSREGRESIEAVISFGGLLSVYLWGGPFFHGLILEIARILRR